MIRWLFFAFLAAAGALSTPLYRSGKLRRLFRYWRDPNLPAIIRTSGATGPPFCVLMLPVIIALAPDAFHISVPMSRASGGALMLAFDGYFFACVGLLLLLSYRPPRWLIPPWVRDEDAQLGWTLPDGNWIDKGVAVLGVFAILLGVGFVAVAVTTFFSV